MEILTLATLATTLTKDTSLKNLNIEHTNSQLKHSGLRVDFFILFKSPLSHLRQHMIMAVATNGVLWLRVRVSVSRGGQQGRLWGWWWSLALRNNGGAARWAGQESAALLRWLGASLCGYKRKTYKIKDGGNLS